MSGRPGARQTRPCRRCGQPIDPLSADGVRAGLRICDDCRLGAPCPAKGLTAPTKALPSGIGGARSAHPAEDGAMDSLLDHLAARPPDPVYTMTECARRLGISDSYLSKLIAKGTARRSVRTAGGRLLFAPADVAALARAINREDRLGDPEAA